MTTEEIPVEKIRRDGGTQARATVLDAKIDEYAALYTEGIGMPPIVVFYDGADYWLADGFHRFAAMLGIGRESAEADVRAGTRRDAVFFACSANSAHGIPMNNEDKRRAARILLEDDEWRKMSFRAMARHIGVSHTFVRLFAAELRGVDPADDAAGLETDSTPAGGAGGTPVDSTSSPFEDTGIPPEVTLTSGPPASEDEPRSGVAPAPRGDEGDGAPDAGASAAPSALPDGERAEFDAYYTPKKHARACFRWLLENIPEFIPQGSLVVEPAVGSGNWVEAVREEREDMVIDAYDISADAPGLGLISPACDARVRNWLDPLPPEDDPEKKWDLCIGNPPYKSDAIVEWFEVSRRRARVVAFLLRETVTGSDRRFDWWRTNPPAFIVKVLPRPAWEGPGARPAGDMCDSQLVVWIDGWDERTAWDLIHAGREA